MRPVSSLEPIDLLHQGERVVGVYLLETPEGPALFDCGPSSSIEALKAGLAERGLALTDLRHLLLSHIHLDHAGAAGSLVREHPALQVHVSGIGAPHPVAPPPDVDLEAWQQTLQEIDRRAPDRLALIHFGVADDPDGHIPRMREELALWAERVRSGMTEDEFVAAARRDLDEAEEGDAPYYERAAPLWESHAGLKRYWDKRTPTVLSARPSR